MGAGMGFRRAVGTKQERVRKPRTTIQSGRPVVVVVLVVVSSS